MLRERFPIFESRAYINSCSKGALSVDVREAYERYLSDWESLGSPWDLWVRKLEEARSSFARLINADPDEVAVVTSASAAVNAVASALDPEKRKRIFVSDLEFPTVAQIWHAQARRGFEIMHVPEHDGTIDREAYERLVDERTALVSVAQVCYRNGALQDVPTVLDVAHSHGALVLLDAYQGLGAIPLDVKEQPVDIVIAGALKYLLGSSGLAFMYVRRDLLEQLDPATTGWFAQAPENQMNIHAHRPAADARRFEAGTPPVPNLYAGLAGLSLIHSAGVNAIQAHINDLTDRVKLRSAEEGYVLATPTRHGPMLAIKALEADSVVAALGRAGVIVSSRDGNVRVSLHLYNEVEDIERLFEGLAENRKLLARRSS